MTLLYCTVSSAINQKTTTFITHHDGERWATEVIRTMNSSDTQTQHPAGKAISSHTLDMPCPAAERDTDKSEARPAGGGFWERDRPFTQSEINIRRMFWSYFCTSCLHLANKQAHNQIPRSGESGGRGA